MSKADKMRGRLANIQKEREDFERQKKELEADMNVGRNNMSKINKGLRNNAILDEPIVVDNHKVHHHSGKPANGHKGDHSHNHGHNYSGSNPSYKPSTPKNGQFENNMASSQNMGSSTAGAGAMGVTGNANPANQLNIMPSGPRVSDWCYSAPIDSPAPPQVKSRELYENVRLLGRGSFGEVNLVKNVEDNKLFAIKTQLCPKDNDFHNVLREVRFLRSCRHPCIIDVHDAFLIINPSRIVYIVMHYCESGTISSVISSARKNKSTLAENQIIKWVLQLALAMQYLHDNHVVHRDLKPMNVMLTEGGDSLKLADFGLAMSMAEKAEEETTDEAGTPYYTAPEMIVRDPYSYPADCWSFGVIVHQLLALERPFDGSSTAELVKSILSGEVPSLPVHYSEDIKLISRELLRKDQTERLTMTELLLEPMFYAKLASFPQSYRPRTLEERIRRSHQKQLECQMESLNRVRKADGASNLHDRVALRQAAAEEAVAAAALAAAAVCDLTNPDASATGTGTATPYDGSTRNSISRHPSVSQPLTASNTRDGTPNRLTINSGTGRRHTDSATMLSEELSSAEQFIRASRSNVEDVTRPTDGVNFSPLERTAPTFAMAIDIGNAEQQSEMGVSSSSTAPSAVPSPMKESREKLEPVVELSMGSENASMRFDAADVEKVAETASIAETTPQEQIADSEPTTTAGADTINDINRSVAALALEVKECQEEGNNTTTDSVLPRSVGPAGLEVEDADVQKIVHIEASIDSLTALATTAEVPTEASNMSRLTPVPAYLQPQPGTQSAQTIVTAAESLSLPSSRPVTPHGHGGRKGQEIAQAIENDQFYEAVLSETDITDANTPPMTNTDAAILQEQAAMILESGV